MLPRHGVASGVFLLANAARSLNHHDLDALIGTARQRSSFMAGAVDLRGCAEGLMRLGLMDISDTVNLSALLSNLSERADRATLVGISSLLLRLDPPPWLLFAVEGGRRITRVHPLRRSSRS